jgi:hypothetical protein
MNTRDDEQRAERELEERIIQLQKELAAEQLKRDVALVLWRGQEVGDFIAVVVGAWVGMLALGVLGAGIAYWQALIFMLIGWIILPPHGSSPYRRPR